MPAQLDKTMKAITSIHWLASLVLLLAAQAVLAQQNQGGGSQSGDGSPSDTGSPSGTSAQYQNHWSTSTGDPATEGEWWKNTSRFSNGPVPKKVDTRQQVVPPQTGARVEPPGPRPGGPITPADVQAMVRQFQQDREAFMAQQRVLEQQMKGASEQERQRLRQQLKTQMEQWKQQQARLREQLREQCDRMAEQLRDHQRLVNRVGAPGSSSGETGGTGPRGR